MKKWIWPAALAIMLFTAVMKMFQPMQVNAQPTAYYRTSDVLYAIAGTKSIHFTGWCSDPFSGERKRVEGWIKGHSQLALKVEGGDGFYYDGSTLTEIHREGGFKHATIRPRMYALWVREGLSYLQVFTRLGFLYNSLEDDNAAPGPCKYIQTEDGRSAVVINADNIYCPSVITVDANTLLPLKWQEYNFDGDIVGELERFEYDTEIPESAFRVEGRESLPVNDLTSSNAALRSQKALKRQITSLPGTEVLLDVPTGKKGVAKRCPGLVFEAIGPRGFTLFRLPDKKTCRVLGKAFVFSLKRPQMGRLIEDEDIDLYKNFRGA